MASTPSNVDAVPATFAHVRARCAGHGVVWQRYMLGDAVSHFPTIRVCRRWGCSWVAAKMSDSSHFGFWA